MDAILVEDVTLFDLVADHKPALAAKTAHMPAGRFWRIEQVASPADGSPVEFQTLAFELGGGDIQPV